MPPWKKIPLPPVSGDDAGRPALFVLDDHLSVSSGPLARFAPGDADLLFVESREAMSRLPVHRKKLALRLAASRHLAHDLAEAGHRVWYFASESGWTSGLRAFAERRGTGRLLFVDGGESDRIDELVELSRRLGFTPEVDVEEIGLLPFDRFLPWFEENPSASPSAFVGEFGGEIGLCPLPAPPSAWTAASAAESAESVPPLPIFPRDSVVREVLEEVEREFSGHFGTSDGFNLPTTRGQVAELVDHFLLERLPLWSAAQVRPRMRTGQPFLCQSIIDPYLSMGLVTSRELVARVRAGVASGEIPAGPASVFMERVVGTREFLRLARKARPESAKPVDPFGHRQPLPAVLSRGETPMRCLSDTLRQIRHHGFAPTSQRTVLIGNLLVLAEADPDLVQEWYRIAFLDSRNCPVRPSLLSNSTESANLAPAREICDASDYCGSCEFDPDVLAGDLACPYNVLFWDFVDRNRSRIEQVPRLSASLPKLDAMSEEERRRIRADAELLRRQLAGEVAEPVVSR